MSPKNLKQAGEWRSPDIVFCLAQDPHSSRLWLGSSDFGVYEFDVAVEKPERVPFTGEAHESYVTGMVRIGQTLVTSSYDGRLIWWDTESRTSIRRVAAHERWIRAVIATPDAKYVVSVADDMQCKVWDAVSGEAVAAFTDHASMTPHHFPSMLYAVAASPDGKCIASGDRVGHVAIWDTERFEKIGEVEAPVMYTWDPRARRHSIGGIRSLAFSPDSKRLAVGGTGKIGNIDHLEGAARLEIFDWASGKQERELEDSNKKGLIEQILWPAEHNWILTVGGDHNGFVTVYDAENGELIHQEGQSGHIHAISHDQDFKNLYAAAHERITRWTMAAE